MIHREPVQETPDWEPCAASKCCMCCEACVLPRDQVKPLHEGIVLGEN